MLREGIQQTNPTKEIDVIPNEKEAILYAVKNATKGSLIVICSDVVTEALELVQKLKEDESNKLYEFSLDDIPNQHT